VLTALLNGTEAPAAAEYFSHNSGASANKIVAYFTVFLPRYEASGRISPDRNFPPSTGKVDDVEDAGDTDEGDADEHDTIEEEEGGDDAGDGNATIEEDEADDMPPPANLASTIALASANSFSYFMLGRTPIRFRTPVVRLTLRRSLITFISAPISIVSSVSFNKGILLHQV
jgi:hypothetical protein